MVSHDQIRDPNELFIRDMSSSYIRLRKLENIILLLSAYLDSSDSWGIEKLQYIETRKRTFLN